MAFSQILNRKRLYLKALLAVTCVLFAAALPPTWAQYAKRRQISKGPRALGLLELASNGKAHLIPITIMIDGKFYDAGAYKADPIPMALQSETVYEAIKSGVSQGLFTVAGAMRDKDSWVADGKYQTDAQIAADKALRAAERAKLNQKAPDDAASGPPKLRRSSDASDSNNAGDKTQGTSKNTGDQSPAPQKPQSTSPSAVPDTRHSSADASSSTGSAGFVNTPDRPILRRSPPDERTQNDTKSGSEITELKGPIQLIPAISDAAGPEPRSYVYDPKPEDKQKWLKQMLGMAGESVQARAAHLSSESEPAAKSTRKAEKKPSQPEFRDVQFETFDLSTSNEPVLVLTANASIPNSPLNLQYSTAVVAREDIYGELHKVFDHTTDNQHLDVVPRYDFIDAVDATGSGRAELLFRTTWDAGPAYALYDVIGDRLWPVFEGKPGS
jgi:hypothetical protein